MSWVSIVVILTVLQTGHFGVWFPVGARDLSFSRTSTLTLGFTHPCIQYVLGTISPAVRWTGHGVDDSPPPRAEVKNEWSYTSLSAYIPSWCSQGQLCPYRILITIFLHSKKKERNTVHVGVATDMYTLHSLFGNQVTHDTYSHHKIHHHNVQVTCKSV
jgi:hypothetical protein